MKINFKSIFTAALAVMTLASCSKDNNENGIDGTDAQARLNITVSAPESRAVGTDKPTDNVINNFTAFVEYSDGTLVSAYSATGSDLTGTDAITVSKTKCDSKDVYVVANGGDLTSITTLTALKGYIADLNKTSGGQQEATKVWATGKTATGLTFSQSGNDFTASANVALTFIAARITVTIEDGMNGDYDPSDPDKMKLENVAVLNARGGSYLFGTSLIPADADLVSPAFTGTKFYTGIDATGWDEFPATADYAVAPMLKDAITANDFASVYNYYVFENDAITAADFPTIVTLVATFKGQTIFYPVHLAPYEQMSGSVSGIERGKSYNLNIKLSVDPENPGGTTDPTKPDVTAKVEVEVTINDWLPVVLEKEFQ